MDSEPGGAHIVALKFPDGLRAATFALALRRAIRDARRAADSGTLDRALVWMDHPLQESDLEMCCVYVTPTALDAARRAGLPIPEALLIEDPEFPAGRLRVLEVVTPTDVAPDVDLLRTFDPEARADVPDRALRDDRDAEAPM